MLLHNYGQNDFQNYESEQWCFSKMLHSWYKEEFIDLITHKKLLQKSFSVRIYESRLDYKVMDGDLIQIKIIIIKKKYLDF